VVYNQGSPWPPYTVILKLAITIELEQLGSDTGEIINE
jgi:hypothetical protein